MEAIFTAIIVIGIMVVLGKGLAAPDAVMFAALAVLMLTGIISPNEALSGFSNKGVITIALLFVISQALLNTGAMNGVINAFLKPKRNPSRFRLMMKMMVPVTALSAFLNNTPVVIMFVPVIKKWAERLGLSSSKFLIPLSYAAIFGGLCTLVGTSTNLMVHGLMLDRQMPGLSMFELAKIGVPCAIVGWFYLAFFGDKLLPDRRDMMEVVGRNSREYVIIMEVSRKCRFIGKTIAQAQLRNLKGLFLVEIERKGRSLGPVSSNACILEGDRLMFAGITAAVIDLCNIPGLVPIGDDTGKEEFRAVRANLVEAVVSAVSPMVGKTIKECKFRAHYDAGVLAVHRNGERICSKIGSIKLRPGDTLLLLTKNEFVKQWKNSQDFYLISTVFVMPPKAHHKAFISLGIVSTMILMVAFSGILPKIGGQSITMIHAAFAAAFFLIATKCIRVYEAKRSIQWEVIVALACAIGVGKAIHNSGLAGFISQGIITAFSGFGPIGVLAAVYLLTMFFTEFITNNATAALVFPIAYSSALKIGVDPRPFCIAVAIAASASFMTPIGYQTNLLVQGAGNYKFRDYIKIGMPLSLMFFIATLILVPIFWKF